MKNQKKDLSLLQNIVNSLAAGEQLPEKYKDDFQKLKNTLFKTLYPIETNDNND